jgi:hypothetical protein
VVGPKLERERVEGGMEWRFARADTAESQLEI